MPFSSYSIGGPLREIMNDAANAVHEAGVVMVVAAGNKCVAVDAFNDSILLFEYHEYYKVHSF